MAGNFGDVSSGNSTPNRALGFGRPASPFDGFGFKNVSLLSKINRKLTSTPTPLNYSPLAGPESDDGSGCAGKAPPSPGIM